MATVRLLLAGLAISALAYAALLGLLYLKQRSLLFYPQFTRNPPLAPDFELPVEGAVLRGWVVNPGCGPALLYFGGNGEDVSLARDEVARWAPGHTSYLVSYRGYGHSSGEPSEAALAADAKALFDHVAARHAAVDVFGRSLGSGVAVHVAAARPVRRLALVTPFDSVLRVGQAHYPWAPLPWLLRDPFESWRRAPRLTMPILVVIAGEDDVIPPRHSEALVAALPRPPERLYLPRAQHSNVQVFPEYAAALRAFFGAEAGC
ncbi:alpha/beta hydrolase [Silanimonas lenta]|uniref:alpha/beta hydrolase n=1 Tax=Silanimonas lenta TaxID=265429 RepID=UPI002FE155D5